MSRLLDGIRRDDFLVFGRAGMDLWADPPGTRSTQATHFASGLGGSAEFRLARSEMALEREDTVFAYLSTAFLQDFKTAIQRHRLFIRPATVDGIKYVCDRRNSAFDWNGFA